MKILWYSNVLLPDAAKACGIAGAANSAGWIEGFLQGIARIPEIDLSIVCPGNVQKTASAGGGASLLHNSYLLRL